MLQFLAGSTTLDIGWLTMLVIGTGAYNTPPLFFVAAFVLFVTGLYAFRLRREMVLFVLLIGTLGTFSAFYHGISIWNLRQILAFVVSAAVWLYLYQLGSQRDIFNLQNAKWILIVYTLYMVIALLERELFSSANFVYAVGDIFGVAPDWLASYALSGTARLSYFSVEPSSAACAIAAIIMPFIVARAIVEPRVEAYLWLALACLVLYWAEGLTSQLLLLFTFAFLLFRRKATQAVPVVFVGISALVLSFMQVLTNHYVFTQTLQNLFGGLYSRIDQGIQSGSYLSRLGDWFIAARAFLDSPVIGQGFGGSGEALFGLMQSGYDVDFTSDQSQILAGGTSTINAELVWRVPSELGAVGTVVLLYYGWRAFKVERRAAALVSSFDYHVYLYALGVMLVSFITNGEFSLPTISAFVVLLAQTKRKCGDFTEVEKTVSIPILRKQLTG